MRRSGRSLLLAGAVVVPLLALVVAATTPGTSSAPAPVPVPAAPTPVEVEPEPAPPPPPDAFVAVSRRGVHDLGFIALVAADPRVTGISRLRSDTLGLTEAVAADGGVVERHTGGWRVPVSVTALDPPHHARVVGADEAGAAALAALAPGAVLLSESGAGLRGVGVGATVTIAGRLDLSRALTLTVAGVVPDGLVNGAELAVHLDDADALGLDTRESLLVRHRDDGERPDGTTAGARMAEDLEALWLTVGRTDEEVDDAELRARALGVDSGPRLILGATEVKERFGEFAYRPTPNVREVDVERAWLEENLRTVRLPVIGAVNCHRLILDDLAAAVDDLVAAGYSEWLSPRRYAGCWYPRRIMTGRAALSRHTWGIAIDLNVDMSAPGLGAEPPDELIAIMGRHGFRWGGDFTTPDNHHWEWLGAAAAERPERDAGDAAADAAADGADGA
ncbi:MAG: M15 family metallopeptidase [Nitriliruptoraceae bacterium]